MTSKKSKELVPRSQAGKLVTTTEPDPTPLWTGAVKAVLSEVHQLAQDHDVFPDDRDAGRQHLSRKLRDLVGRMDSGRWMDGRETLPEPEPVEQETVPLTHAPARAIDELLAPDWQAKWDAMDLEARLAWTTKASNGHNDRA